MALLAEVRGRWQFYLDNLDAPLAKLPIKLSGQSEETGDLSVANITTIFQALQNHTVRASWKTEIRAPLSEIFGGREHYRKYHRR